MDQARTSPNYRLITASAAADTVGGKKMLLPSAFNWLFLPLEHDRALPEGVQEQVERAKKRYIRKVVRLAERVSAGEFGEVGSENFRPMAVATRIRRVLHDFVNGLALPAGQPSTDR